MVEIGFYALSFVAVAMLTLLFRSYPKSKMVVGFLVVVGWVSYLIVLAQTEVLKSFQPPPRIPLLVVIPAILLIILLVNRKSFRAALATTPFHIPIALQSFRIFVELLIYATYQKGIFPQRATFEGLNFDIVVGMSAVFISIAIYKGAIRTRGILIWNVASLGVLLVTVYSFISTYYFTAFATSGAGYRFVEFPYLLLASVLLPVAIFLHAFSIKQVLMQETKT